MKVILLIVAVVVAAAAVIGSRHHGAAPSTPGPGSTTDVAVPNDSGQTVVLEVIGDKADEAHVTWSDGGRETDDDVTLPWTVPAAAPASLTALNMSPAGSITCRVWQGPKLLDEAKGDRNGACTVAWEGS